MFYQDVSDLKPDIKYTDMIVLVEAAAASWQSFKAYVIL